MDDPEDQIDEPDEQDDRPPICPACGVTMGFALQGDGSSRVICLECGFGVDE